MKLPPYCNQATENIYYTPPGIVAETILRNPPFKIADAAGAGKAGVAERLSSVPQEWLQAQAPND